MLNFPVYEQKGQRWVCLSQEYFSCLISALSVWKFFLQCSHTRWKFAAFNSKVFADSFSTCAFFLATTGLSENKEREHIIKREHSEKLRWKLHPSSFTNFIREHTSKVNMIHAGAGASFASLKLWSRIDSIQ